VIDVVPEPGNPETNHKFKLLCTAEDKGPVTAIEAVNGYLLTTFATKVVFSTLSFAFTHCASFSSAK
jgi:cleavage and polyadenylation specificity factor subunit 1